MTDLKQMGLRIFHETITAINIPATMRRKLQLRGTTLHCGDVAFDLTAFDRVLVVALGKAARVMVDGLAEVLPRDLQPEGIVVTSANAEGQTKSHEGWRYFVGRTPGARCGELERRGSDS